MKSLSPRCSNRDEERLPDVTADHEASVSRHEWVGVHPLVAGTAQQRPVAGAVLVGVGHRAGPAVVPVVALPRYATPEAPLVLPLLD